MTSQLITPGVPPSPEVAVREYGVFWQTSPQFNGTGAERQQVGFELELIGSHTPDPTHLDPSCPMCDRVRSALLAVADAVIRHMVFSAREVMCDIDSHGSRIMRLPALGNRSAVSVSVNVGVTGSPRPIGANVLDDIKDYLADCGVQQR